MRKPTTRQSRPVSAALRHIVRVAPAGALLLAGMWLAGCKPTEQGYRAAYEAARSKQKAAEEALGVTVPLQHDDGISLRAVGGDSVWVSHELVKAIPLDEADTVPANVKGKYGVAVAKYRMPTNARAQVETLRGQKVDALLAGNGSDLWYVVREVADDLRTAALKARRYTEEHPSEPTIGVPGAVLVYLR